MIFQKRRIKPSFNRQPPLPQKEQKKSCKRVVKRDDKGRITREEFTGCTKEEIKAMRELENTDSKD